MRSTFYKSRFAHRFVDLFTLVDLQIFLVAESRHYIALGLSVTNSDLETLMLFEMNQGDLGYSCLICGQLCKEKSHIYRHKKELEVIRQLRSRALRRLSKFAREE